jgi:hypothetical protein
MWGILNKLTVKKLEKNGVCVTNCKYWLQYLPNGGAQWLLPKPWTSSIGQCMWYCTGAPAQRHGHQNGQQSWSIFSSVFCLMSPCWPPRQYGESSRPMVVSIGFRGSHGQAALGDAVCITPMCSYGRRNCLQWR